MTVAGPRPSGRTTSSRPRCASSRGSPNGVDGWATRRGSSPCSPAAARRGSSPEHSRGEAGSSLERCATEPGLLAGPALPAGALQHLLVLLLAHPLAALLD